MLVEKLDKNKKDLVFIYTTCTNRDEARSLGLSAVNNHLAVCADFWLIESVYPWNGVVQDVDQYMLVCTTQRELGEKLIKFILSIHSYSIPVISESGAQNKNPAYALWADKTLWSQDGFISEHEDIMRKKSDEYGLGKLK